MAVILRHAQRHFKGQNCEKVLFAKRSLKELLYQYFTNSVLSQAKHPALPLACLKQFQLSGLASHSPGTMRPGKSLQAATMLNRWLVTMLKTHTFQLHDSALGRDSSLATSEINRFMTMTHESVKGAKSSIGTP